MAVSPSTDRFNGYVSDLAVKAPCVAVAIANITLSGEQTVNGVAVVSGDRVLVTSQTSSVDNGIYVASTSAWERAPDFDGNRDVADGTLCTVATTGAGRNPTYQVNGTDPISVGTDAITFTLADAPNVSWDLTTAESNLGLTDDDINDGYEPGSVIRYGAIGNGAADDSSPINTALGLTGHIIKFPNGSYDLGTTKLEIDTSVTLDFDPGVTLTQSSTSVSLMEIDDTTDVTIYGNNCLFQHSRSAAGNNTLYIRGSSRVNVYGVRFKDSPKDAIYLGDSVATPGNQNTDIHIRDCEFDLARRQGISAIHVTRLKITDCQFHDISGDSPQAGIDLETNTSSQDVSHVTIKGCDFYDIIAQAGIIVSSARQVNIVGNNFKNCLVGISIAAPQASTTEKTISAVDHTTEQFTITAHGLSKGDRLILTTTGGGTIPTGATASVVYRVLNVVDVNTVTLSTYYDAVPLAITSNGSLPLQARVYSNDATAHITIGSNTFDEMLNQAIFADVATNVTIVSNVVYGGDPDSAIFALNNVDYSTVSKNQILNPTDGEGIFMSGIGNKVMGNTVVGAPDEGIRYYGGHGSKVDDNILIDCGQDSTQAGDFRYFNDGSLCGNRVWDKSGLGVSIGFNMHSNDSQGNVVDDNNFKDGASSNANSLLNLDRENTIGTNNQLDDGEHYSAHLRASTTSLEDSTHAVNTYNKYEGKRIFNSTTNIPVWASGNGATDTWLDATGSTDHTPTP